ncbi:MAG TPA: hypothetical protein PLM22_02770 [Candidatus Sabulitectum sp.]|nr:hypothetical protein [Candidatus Sabulitectum sp.]HPF33110.1 hypothetical protein [Candidatus Sabulitectum sp.]HPJ27829.1 hypothetical protein [Candidatus Sabulitectum sp.]HPR21973.1 hypothetical protein [Candidatus Sabulitectum sp.]
MEKGARDHIAQADLLVEESGNNRRRAKRSFPTKAILLVFLFLLLAASAVKLALALAVEAKPAYTEILPDSASIAESAILLEEMVRARGGFPDGFVEHLETTDGVSLTVNEDGSFTYSEGGIEHRSAPGLLTGEANR